MLDNVVAIHESGHVFVAVALRLRVRGVQLGDSPRFDFTDTPGPECRLDHVRVLMAGGEAERAVFGREPIGGGSDDRKIAELLTDDDDEAALRDEVRRLLELNAGTVRFLAAKLARRGLLTGDEVEAIVRA